MRRDQKFDINCLVYDQNRIILGENNIETLNNAEYYIEPLSEAGNKGGNSYVFKLRFAEDEDEPYEYQFVIKVSKQYDLSYDGINFKEHVKNAKFYREISALKRCASQGCPDIIRLLHTGYAIIPAKEGRSLYYPYYAMEFASDDLKSYLEKYYDEIDLYDRATICLDIANGINDLHKMGIYHRDIKPDNILLVGGRWKIGDLGLIAFRNQDIDDLYREREWVGPRGWMSPEGMNRYLAEGLDRDPRIDCDIDEASDVFQLGKVFWYIIQGNAPIGNTDRQDFFSENDELHSIIIEMLHHSKAKRPTIKDTINKLSSLLNKL